MNCCIQIKYVSLYCLERCVALDPLNYIIDSIIAFEGLMQNLSLVKSRREVLDLFDSLVRDYSNTQNMSEHSIRNPAVSN